MSHFKYDFMKAKIVQCMAQKYFYQENVDKAEARILFPIYREFY
jgi:hypothetical protein